MMYRDLMAGHVTPLMPIPTGQKPLLEIKRPIHAVLFDIYGTLFVSASGDISRAKQEPRTDSKLKRLIQAYGLPMTASLLLNRFFSAIEKSHDEMINRGVDFPEVEIDRIWMQVLQTHDIRAARRFAVEYEMLVNPVYPMPHLNEMLEALKKRGVSLGIISNAQFFTPYLFDLFCGGFPEQLGFNPNLIFYSYQHDHAKPSLLMYETAAERLRQAGILPGAVLYVGNDMKNDIRPAQTVGFQACLFAGDMRSLRLREDDPGCASLTPDMVVTNLMQIADMLKCKTALLGNSV